MKIIVGLGNPGERYANTRHNAGRLVLEHIGKKENLKFSRKKAFKSLIAETSWQGEEILLSCPETYVNLSGEAVALLLRYYSIRPSRDLLVIVDDLSLPYGEWRLRAKGSSGGHNGLKSIEASIGTAEYSRLRFGIGHPADHQNVYTDEEVRDYVLKPFGREERGTLDFHLEQGGLACRIWAENALEKAMNAVNGRK